MLRQLNMPGYEETGDEFIEAELEMLAMGAKDIPQGSALGKLSFCMNICAAGAVRTTRSTTAQASVHSISHSKLGWGCVET
jgi:hypothetical protein